MDRVFVSSTCYDLLDLRAEVEAHIRDVGLRPVMSDRATSDFVTDGTADSIETCLVNVRDADVFVCLLSQRYGADLTKFGHPGLSATHVEYREAKKHGKPILFYVRDRTEGEYGIWKRTDGPRVFPWVKDPETLFAFLDEHRAPPTLAGPKESNWLTTFTTSRDLKERLSADLKARSLPALLRRLVDAGLVPFFAIEETASGSDNLRRIRLRPTGRALPVDVILPHRTEHLAMANDQAFHAILTRADVLDGTLRAQCVTEQGHLIEDTFQVEWGPPFVAKLTRKRIVEASPFEIG